MGTATCRGISRLIFLSVALLAVQGQQGSDSCVNDGQAPTITTLSISPTSTDVTNRAREVRVRFTVTDTGAPIDLCSASLRSPDRQHPQFVVLSGEAEDARSCSSDGRTCDMNLLGTVRPNVVSGRWSLELSCRDSPCEPSQPRNEFVLAGKLHPRKIPTYLPTLSFASTAPSAQPSGPLTHSPSPEATRRQD
jgi:hypothetical protein